MALPEPGPTDPLRDPTACTLARGDLTAIFLPGRGMLGASLCHRGSELLRRTGDLKTAAAKGSTAGIPFLHPWANRLAGPRYEAAGQTVNLAPSSPLLHLDENGLPIHGVPWSRLAWQVTKTGADHLTARLDWTRVELLEVFPFPHRVEMAVALNKDGLSIETTLTAGPEGPVPVSFGYHPYLGLPGLPRDRWRLRLPAMRRLLLDERSIPTGAQEPVAAVDGALGDQDLDDGFALVGDQASLSISGGGTRLTVDLIAGYPYTQVFAPKGKDYVALEPMTAPTNALASGCGLHFVDAGQAFRAAFRIGIDAT